MNLSENYNTSKQKYGNELVLQMAKAGIPSKYLLSACKFYIEKNVPINNLQQLYRQWMTFVVKNNNNIDVNNLSFEEFQSIIQKFKIRFGLPNQVYNDGQISIGKIMSAKEVSKLPFRNTWCIKQPNMFQKYKNRGYSFYIIDNGDTSDYVRYVMLMIGKDGSKYFYDLDNSEMTPQSVSEFQSHLTQESLYFIQNLNESKSIYDKKKTIKLTESELHELIKESVNMVLKEYVDNPIFGWKLRKKHFKEAGVSNKDINKLKKAYDKYAYETISKGSIPNDTGFDLWRDEKDIESCEQVKE